MPYILKDLVVDRVDIVDEGANSAAFIELYKRKEMCEPMDFAEIIAKMKPEHAEVIQQELTSKDAELSKARSALEDSTGKLEAANDALAKANVELNTLKAASCECDGEADEKGMCKACGKPKKKVAKALDEEEILKSMPEAARELFTKMRAQKEAAEAQVRKAAEDAAEAEAVAKAASMKALPIEQSKLVGILKTCTPEVTDLLTAVSATIESATLDEVGKNKGNGAGGNEDAWAKLEKAAVDIAKRDTITKEKAMAIAIAEHPDLYKEYVNGGAN